MERKKKEARIAAANETAEKIFSMSHCKKCSSLTSELQKIQDTLKEKETLIKDLESSVQAKKRVIKDLESEVKAKKTKVAGI